ncbi:hypothetical protein LTR91_014292 [Friedmanniomyces endolithicus]|uniref:Protein arginine N-methyltransferase n=1 Tax=Friedmanniomyces endolithicus TaxID=329885 RepID=A0AAN6KBU0_9PEZI|nr:hypothetical protein LTR38_008413 [Friedmanniomyces endolithicus]KAK0811485.1 hypothetical protein LTR59_001940 [Friedmanniomyces endolithicus]KAK0866430.1 hypothetical protein LTS02_004751 [Friedmanniomyces endolithicus]KAK0914030.1 hypothetical protein LTR02_002033 [Friedmanniomyces endolithicus]KAK0918991.1 hypothetical protein LTR57_011242 [Friedmanniomyces endolithicus]
MVEDINTFKSVEIDLINMTSTNGGNVLPAEEPPTVLYVGQHETQRSEQVNVDLLRRAQDHGYDLLTTPITTPKFQSRVLELLESHMSRLETSDTASSIPLPMISSLSPEDSDLVPEDSNSSLIAVTSPWIDMASLDPLIAHISRQIFSLEVAYAAFCGVSNVLVHGPTTSEGTARFARTILEALGLGAYVHLHLLMPMTGELEQDVSADGTHLAEMVRPQYASADEDESEGEPELFASWEMWNTIRTICSYTTRLSIALEVPRGLPPQSLQCRWYSEPIRLLMLPRTSFLRNGKGYPVLSKQHQHFLTLLLRLRFPPWALLSDCGRIPLETTTAGGESEPTPGLTPAEAAASRLRDSVDDPTQHLQYMRHLQQSQPSRPPIERFGQGYQDYMQSPLQPLTDNLESITYEVFEKDPVKYEWYERAIALALKDLRALLGDERQVIVAVAGAGRGPLVTRVLQASRKTGINVKCYAVEKNPNAHLLLQRRNATDPLWANQVTVVASDMRSWPGPTTTDGSLTETDLLVSELLGSFADNELSPECLDGVQHVLHPGHGISIPQSFSAHLTPIASPRLHSDLLSRASTDISLSVSEKWEIPYVVMLHQFDYLSTAAVPATAEGPRTPDVQQAWSFSHPVPAEILAQARQRGAGGTAADTGTPYTGPSTNDHNARSCTLRFACADRGVCHGLAGYFETVLYSSPNDSHKNNNSAQQTIELSTNPVTMAEKSKDMISWFPIFFPLKTPLFIPDGGEMEVSMWRQTDDRKVWYEWVGEVYVHVPVGEEGGTKRLRVGMSELHSSRRNGCMM